MYDKLHWSSQAAKQRAAAAPAAAAALRPQRSAPARAVLPEQTMGTERLHFPNPHQAYQIHNAMLILENINYLFALI